MAKIRKLYDEAIKPDGTKQVIYPITSTRAVYTTSNITVDAVLGEGYRFGGVVGPTDSPSFLDQRVFYAASIPGVYTNFGGISVNGGEAVFLIYDGISWSKGVFGGAGYSNLSGFVVLDSISELPREKTTLGYLIADESLPVGFSKEILYVWVGEHGDTLDGLYQNCGQLRGASAYEVAVWNGYEGTQEEWLNDPVNGIKGISVQSFEIEGEYNPAESAVNTYKVTLSNGDSLEMPIKNGSGIKQIEAETISYENGGISTYKITLSDNREYTFQVRNGKTSCGLFGTAEALAEKYPSPEVGDYAFVGSAFPALIYVCNTAGEWTNTEETYDGDNVDLTEYAKSEDVGYYIQNPEYVRVYTDAEDKILWGIKADGTIYFGAGVPPQIVDYVEAAVASVTPQGYEEVLAFLDDAMATDKTLAQLLAERDEAIQAVDGKIDAETLRATEAEDAKVDKVEGESLVNSDFANGIQYIDNPEFVEVKVDSEDKILEAIKADGSKYIGGDLTVNGEIINPGFDAKIDAAIEEMKAEVQETIEEITKDLDVETLSSFSTNENPEYISVTTDSEDKILEGIKSDGTKEINLPTVINNDLQVLGSLDISGATYSLCQSPEWIKVLVDSQERIIAGVRTDGSVYINKIEGLDSQVEEIVNTLFTNKSTLDKFSESSGVLYWDDDPVEGNAPISLTVAQYEALTPVEGQEYLLKEEGTNGQIIKHYIGDLEVKMRQDFNLENTPTRAFLHSFLYNNNDYSYTNVTNYYRLPSSKDRTYPLPAYVSIDKGAVASSIVTKIVVETYLDGALFRTDEFTTFKSILPIYNLIPCKEYEYVIKYYAGDYCYSIFNGRFTTAGQIRDLYIDGTQNVRDIGGWPTVDGKKVKYDKLFRSAELYREGVHEITAAGINELINNIKLDVEIDFGDYDSSPIIDYVEFIRGSAYQISSYNWELSGLADGGLIRNVFNVIVDRLSNGKKILFHCSEGADRTGTVAFVLNAILGVSESDLAKDYELTSMMGGAERFRNVNVNPQLDPVNGYPAMIEYVKSQTGSTLQEKVTNIMLGFGVTQESIETFKEIMLENI